MCGRATNVILAPSAGCEGFARRSVTSVPARKAAQSRANYPSSRIKLDHHMLCRNFVCWLPKTGLLLWIFHAPRTENGPYGYERLGAPSGKEVGEHARKKKEIHYNLVASCSPKLHSDPTFSIALLSPLGPQTGCGAVPRTLETPRHSPPLRSRPRDALFCIASTIKCINGSCNPVRLLEAAELLEADQRKHEGGHSKAQGEAQAKLYMQTWSQTPDQPPLAAH